MPVLRAASLVRSWCLRLNSERRYFRFRLSTLLSPSARLPVLAVDNPRLAGQHRANNTPECTQREGRLLDYSTILYAVEDGILTITLNRPEALNAFSNDMMLEIIDACDRADADDDVKAIIVTGAGRGFCAGADLSRGASTFDSSARQDKHEGINRDGGGRLTLRLY